MDICSSRRCGNVCKLLALAVLWARDLKIRKIASGYSLAVLAKLRTFPARSPLLISPPAAGTDGHEIPNCTFGFMAAYLWHSYWTAAISSGGERTPAMLLQKQIKSIEQQWLSSV